MAETKEHLIARGNACMTDYKFDDALKLFEQALALDTNDPDVWNSVGVALRSLGRYQESVDCFNQSLKLDPRDRQSS